jgi:DNA sulfur modification protein DndE
MTWKVFGGQWADVYEALLIQRCQQDGLPTDSESLSRQLRLHIHRGIGSMTADKSIESIAGLVGRSLL